MAYTKKEDKYSAVWLSHSSISDFLKCPRLYYLKNIWKNKKGRKVNIVSPHMSLGSAVHGVIEPLANLKTEERFANNLIEIYEKVWLKYSGLKGGFPDSETEKDFKERGEKMIKNVIENKGPLANKTVKFYNGDFIPNIYLSEQENIILCGLVDWVEYLEKTDSLRVIDFKTGLRDEREDSFQLPIYKILVESLQKRKVTGAAYWYLDRDKFPKSVEIVDEDLNLIKEKILKIGLEIKQKKKSAKNKNEMEENFSCPYGDCASCTDFNLIQKLDQGELVDKVMYIGVGEYKQDLYFIKSSPILLDKYL